MQTMLKSLPYRLAPVLLVCAALGSTATAAEYTCPASSSLSASPASSSIEGWALHYRQGPIRLSGANVFDGPPADLAALVPGKETGKGDRTRSSWKFEGSFPKGKWISCDYGEGIVSLTRKLEDSVTQCTASFDVQRKPPSLAVRFTCT